MLLSYGRIGAVTGASFSARDSEYLSLLCNLEDPCYAPWMCPSHIILCERPSKVEIVGGKVAGMKWERKAGE